MGKPFLIKRNDTSRSLKAYPRANPMSDFSGATVVFNMRERKGGSVIQRSPAIIDSDAQGTFFRYDWSASDTNTAGQYEAEFEVRLSTGAIETYPNGDWIDVWIREDIA